MSVHPSMYLYTYLENLIYVLKAEIQSFLLSDYLFSSPIVDFHPIYLINQLCRSRISKVLPISCIFEFLTPQTPFYTIIHLCSTDFLKNCIQIHKVQVKLIKSTEKKKKKEKRFHCAMVSEFGLSLSLSFFLFFFFFFFFWWIRIFVLQRMLGIRGKKKGQKPFEKGIEDAETILLSVRGSFG